MKYLEIIAVTSGWDVLSDAVKIGLGALLALLGAMLGRRSDWRRERLRSRRDLILKVGEQFEAGFNSFVDFQTDAEAKIAQGLEVEVDTRRVEMLSESHHRIHSAQALLMILGADAAAKKVHSYGSVVGDALETLRKPEDSRSAAGRLRVARAEVLDALQAEYKRLGL